MHFYRPVMNFRIPPANIRAIIIGIQIMKNMGNQVIATQKPMIIRLKHNSGIQDAFLERVIIVMGNRQIKNNTPEQIKPAAKTVIIK